MARTTSTCPECGREATSAKVPPSTERADTDGNMPVQWGCPNGHSWRTGTWTESHEVEPEPGPLG